MRRFDIREVGHCSRCRRRGAGPARLADLRRAWCGRRTARPRSRGLVVEMHTEMGVPLAKVANLLRNTFDLNVTPWRSCPPAPPTRDVSRRPTRNSASRSATSRSSTPDETGWPSAAGVIGGGRTPRRTDGLCDLLPAAGSTMPYHRAGDRLRRRARRTRRVAGVPVLQGLVAPKLNINHLLRRAKALQEDSPLQSLGRGGQGGPPGRPGRAGPLPALRRTDPARSRRRSAADSRPGSVG